jgi:hypothetical protein
VHELDSNSLGSSDVFERMRAANGPIAANCVATEKQFGNRCYMVPGPVCSGLPIRLCARATEKMRWTRKSQPDVNLATRAFSLLYCAA